jgi:hypothetical protein
LFIACLQEGRGDWNAFFLYLLFVQVPLAHNYFYTKVAYFKIANSTSLQGLKKKKKKRKEKRKQKV